MIIVDYSLHKSQNKRRIMLESSNKLVNEGNDSEIFRGNEGPGAKQPYVPQYSDISDEDFEEENMVYQFPNR